MSDDQSATSLDGSRRLRSSVAMALVLAAASGLPAFAQIAANTVPAEAPATDAPQQTSGPHAEEEQDSQRDRVYVHGRRVVTSIATINVEDAPQTVNVISGEILQEQGVTSLEQALRNVPGITTQIGEGGVMSGDQFFIRGISAKNDIFTDGLRDFGVYTRDAFNYGQVEVFKGPSASAFGRGAAGGGINTTSKTPYAETAGSAQISAGDADHLRITADWNQDFGNGMAGRIAAMTHEGGNTGRDHVYSERWGVAPSFAFGLGSPTIVSIAYLHQDESKLTDYGIPVATVGGIGRPVTDFGVSPSNFYGYRADVDETTVDTVTVRLRHEATSWLTLTSDTRWGAYQRYARFTPASCNATCVIALTDNDPATVPVATPGGPGPWDQDTQGVQNISAAHITAPLGGLRSELTVGLDAAWQHNDRNQYAYGGTRASLDLFNPALTDGVAIAAGRSNIRDTTTRDVGVFANERLWLNGQWSLVGGLRWGAYEVDQNTTTFITALPATCNNVAVPAVPATCYTPVSSNTDFVTPQIGVIWEPAPNQQWYLNYSQSAKPPGASTNNGDTIAAPGTGVEFSSRDLEPEENTNIEIGGRIGLLDDRFQLQGAIFQTKKDNAKIFGSDGLLDVTSGDAQEITGFEIGIAGTITDEWSVNANATFLDTEVTDSTTTYTPVGGTTAISVVGNRIAFTPETAASLWTTYNFTGALAGLEVGGGMTYQGEVFLSTSNLAAIPSYTTVDGFVSYGWDRYRVSLNGYNLSDELYFSQVHGNRVTPGQGRTFVVTLGVVY